VSPRLPDDLAAIAQSLARLHALAVPPPVERAPLRDHAAMGPVAATVALIETQLPALDRLPIAEATRAALAEEIAWAHEFAAASAAMTQPICLVGTDTHPGNFIIEEDGTAVLVDLEKALYGSPAIDLAHATLPTSTTWDRDISVELTRDDTARFYAAWLAAAPAPLTAAARPLLAPSRRLTWLRTMLWCANWRVAVENDPEWAATRIDPALFAHIGARTPRLFRSRIRSARASGMARRLGADRPPLICS